MGNANVKRGEYQYTNKPRSWPRALLSVLRIVREPELESADVGEAAILEVFINQSKWGKKFTKWDKIAREMAERFPELREPMATRKQVPWLDLQAMKNMPENSLGRVYAEYAIERGIDPNLLEPLVEKDEGDWMQNHLYATHDFHHLLTGFYYNMHGEFGISGFYLGQMPKNTFFTAMIAVTLMQRSIKHQDDLPNVLDAFVEGYQMGKRAKCIMALDYPSVLERDIDELRAELNIDQAGKFEEFAIAAE